jgi:hypothetical protein
MKHRLQDAGRFREEEWLSGRCRRNAQRWEMFTAVFEKRGEAVYNP